MEHTVEELLTQTKTAQQHLLLVKIVDEAESAQKAEEKAEKLEFPTPMLREVRLLWKLSQKYPESFANIKTNVPAIPQRGLESRIFPCSYKSKFSEDRYGIMIVTPHSVLPPIFWDYTLRDEEGSVGYSSSHGVGEEYNNSDFAERTECVLAHGSRSLPASLKIIFEKELSGIKIEFIVDKKQVGSYPADTEVFTWIRHIVFDRQSKQKKEWYERTTSSLFHGADHNRAIFKELTEDEVRAFDEGAYYENGEHWSLVLETHTQTPIGEKHNKDISFFITTVYRALQHEKWRECTPDNPFRLKKLEKALLPYRNTGSVHFMWSPFISHMGVRDYRLNVRIRYTSVEEAISVILSHTPDKVDGLAALWSLFGFKSTYGTHIYNISTEEKIRESSLSHILSDPLPPWGTRKEK